MAKLQRAAALISGLSGERERWTQTVADLDQQFDVLPGDVLLTTGSLAYLGPFVTRYRESLTELWKKTVSKYLWNENSRHNIRGFIDWGNPQQVISIELYRKSF